MRASKESFLPIYFACSKLNGNLGESPEDPKCLEFSLFPAPNYRPLSSRGRQTRKLPWDARAHSVARSRRSRAEMFDKQIGNRASKEETTPIDARQQDSAEFYN